MLNKLYETIKEKGIITYEEYDLMSDEEKYLLKANFTENHGGFMMRYHIYFIEKENEYGKPFTFYVSDNPIREELRKSKHINHAGSFKSFKKAQEMAEVQNQNQYFHIYSTIYDKYKDFKINHKKDRFDIPQGSMLKMITTDYEDVKKMCPHFAE